MVDRVAATVATVTSEPSKLSIPARNAAVHGMASSSATTARTTTTMAMILKTVLIQPKLRSHQESFSPSWLIAEPICWAARFAADR